MKLCPKCQEVKLRSDFSVDRQKSDGLHSNCKSCRSEERKARYAANPEADRARSARFRKEHPGYYREYLKNWYEDNKQASVRNAKAWVARNPAKRSEVLKRYGLNRMRRVPPWLTEEHRQKIEEFYVVAAYLRQSTGEDWHVDHIVPLCGKKVNGLHVPWNLQVLPADLNRKKGNKYEV